MVTGNLHNPEPVNLLRRLAAAVYDWLLVIALMMAASFFFVAPSGEPVAAGNRIYQLVLLGVAISFFVGFWSYGGQTPGMRAWKLRITGSDGSHLSISQALSRFVYAAVSFALLGIGFWWQWLDRDGLCWHDRWSDTRLGRSGKQPVKIN